MAQLISQELLTAQRRVELRFMDCFGGEQRVSLSLLAGPSVADKAASILAAMTAGETAVKNYLASDPTELQRQLAAGNSAVAAAIADATTRGITPPLSNS